MVQLRSRYERQRKRPVASGVVSSVALIVAVVASLAGQTGTAAAAAVPVPAASPVPAAPSGKAPAADRSEARPAPKAATGKNVRPGATAQKDTAEQQHAVAARQIGRSGTPDVCSGALAPDTVHTCAQWPAQGASFTVALSRPNDVVLVQVVSTNNQAEHPKLTAPDGSAASCEQPDGYGPARCRTATAGTYTLSFTDVFGSGGFSVAYTTLLSGTSCTKVAAANTSLAAPKTFDGTLAAGSVGRCYTLPMADGDVLRAHVSTGQVTTTVYDATGSQVCSTRQTGRADIDCALKGTAPFRVQLNQPYATGVTYGLTTARLSKPAGCPVVQPQAYGTVPGTGSTTRCRTLRVPATGPYLLSPVGTASAVSGRLYRADGTTVCPATPTEPCTLEAGDYVWARDAGDASDAFGIAFHATDQTKGCTAARDDGFASGPATGTFKGAGQQLCRTLATATGEGLYLVDSPPADGADPDVTVFDAKGVQQCGSDYDFGVCRLTGTAPFHTVLAGPAKGAYRVTIHRTGDATGCTTWAQTPFGRSPGTEVALTAEHRTSCLAIGAGDHSATEMFDYTNTANRVNASVRVYDGAGNAVCGTSVSSTTTCSFRPGVAYTAALVGTGGPDTYHLVRRDISPTATCAAPQSLAVGGTSTGLAFGSALDSGCVRVEGASTDKFWFGVRTPTAAWGTGAELGVADASGTIVCMTQSGSSCRATGSTSYVVFATALGYTDAPIDAHLDTWRIGTAAGWAPECTANSVSPDGFSVRDGVFSESATAYCAVVSMKPSQRFSVYGADNSTTGTPSVSLLSNTRFGGTGSDYAYQCFGNNVGDFSFDCLTGSSAEAGEYVMVVSAGSASTPVEYTMQGVCQQGCSSSPKAPDVSSVSPASGPAGTQQVVLHGTDLTLGTPVQLASNGSSASPYSMSRAVSVSPDGTSLTVLLSTQDVAPGVYDVVVGGPGYTVGTRSPGYLPGAYTVTAAAPAA
ncbi:hypothetical protein SXANM310S_07369 [Streptomyces xanthochromogenes]